MGGPNPYSAMPPYPPSARPRSGFPWLKVILIVGGLIALLIVLACAGLIVLIVQSPDTKVLPAGSVPASYVEQMRELGLLEEGESLRLFYSDGFFMPTEGMYLLTDRHLTVYRQSASEPTQRVPLEQITSIDVQYSDEWIADSNVWVTTRDGLDIVFPLSMEAGGDRRFVELLRESVGEDVEYTEASMSLLGG